MWSEQGLEPLPQVAHADVVASMVDAAATLGADLLVVGSRGHALSEGSRCARDGPVLGHDASVREPESPATGRAFTSVARSTAEDIELALDAADAAKAPWARHH